MSGWVRTRLGQTVVIGGALVLILALIMLMAVGSTTACDTQLEEVQSALEALPEGGAKQEAAAHLEAAQQAYDRYEDDLCKQEVEAARKMIESASPQ